MKIALVGNLAGTANEMLLGLRRAGLHADLFVSPHDYRIMFADLEGQVEYKREWVNCFDPIEIGEGSSRTPRQIINAVGLQRVGLAQSLMNYDLIQSHTCTLNFSLLGYLMFVRMKLKPYLAFATGSDFRELAHHGRGLYASMARDFFHKADDVLLLNADMVEIKDEVDSRAKFFPFVVDEKKYSPQKIASPLKQHQGKLICYMMSNLDFGKSDGSKNRRGIKANDRFIYALNEFRKIDPRIHAIITYRGPDKDEAKKLVNEMYLQDFVTFEPPVVELSRVEKINNADVVIDQFTAGSFGLGAIQVMSMGKPLITNFNNDFLGLTYGASPPVMNATTPDDILQSLLALRDPAIRINLGRRARNWVLEHHASTVVIPRLISLYQKLLDKRIPCR